MLLKGKGYYKDKSGKYIVKIWEDNIEKHLGMYSSEKEAQEQYQKAFMERLKKGVELYDHDVKDGAFYENNYIVFDNGDIFNINGHKLKPHKDTCGYYQLRINGRCKKLHRIVAKCFIPNPLNNSEINHIDGDKSNNNVWNLEWCDRLHNIRHAYANGLIKPLKGEGCGSHKLTFDDVKYIKEHYIPRDPKFNSYALAKKFGVSQGTVSSILNDRNWKWI